MIKIIVSIVAIIVLASAISYGETRAVTGSLTSSVTTSGAISGFKLPNTLQPWNISVSGTWTGSVTLQRSFDNGSTWHDVAGSYRTCVNNV